MNYAAIKKLQKLQKEMEETQKEIEETVVTATSGGVVSVDVLGTKEIISIKILDGFVAESSEDLEMLSDMIVAACNKAYADIEKITKEKMAKYQSLLRMGGMF